MIEIIRKMPGLVRIKEGREQRQKGGGGKKEKIQGKVRKPKNQGKVRKEKVKEK